jgi:subtilisin family serine protease
VRVIHLLAIATVLSSPAAFSQANPTADAEKPVNAATQSAVYIVKFVEPGLLYNTGQNRSFQATAPSATGTRKLDVRSNAAQTYRNYLRSQQDNYIAQINAAIGRTAELKHRYDVTLNGIAISLLNADEAQKLRAIPGILSVDQETIEQLNTDTGPSFIGAPAVWTGGATISSVSTRGEGVVVGVIDSGANADHPSFANDASCGHSVANPKLIATKDCNQSQCIGGTPEDTEVASGGHGVHTASTAVGNPLNTPLFVNGNPLRFPISGVAPCARLITYRACVSTCPGAALLAAANAAIADGVDIVNYSISGGTNPWLDNDRNFLDMLNADILVSASAGNTRAAPNNIAVGAVNHRGPWVMTVANSTHSRVEAHNVSLAGSTQNSPGVVSSSPAIATTLSAAFVPGAVAAGNAAGELACGTTSPFPAGSMTGKIALISRGTCNFSEKVTNAAGAGAIAVVMYNNSAAPPIAMGALEAATIPAVMVPNADGIAMRDFAISNPTALATVTTPATRQINPLFGDVLNASSLRGPNIIGTTTVGTGSFVGTDTTKPDITGPGTDIYAAVNDVNNQFGFLSGTSMSAPHLAGAAALIRSANSSWTPTEVRSAIMLTASIPGRKSDGLLPWDADDVGSGRIDLNNAARSALVMNETFDRYLAANPATSGSQELVRQLNLPSMRNTQMAGSYTFTRTVRNTRREPTSWTVDTANAPTGTTVSVSPSTFQFNGGLLETQVLQVTVTMTAAATAPRFGDIRLNGVRRLSPDVVFADGYENALVIPTARLTIAVQGNP